MYRLYTWTTFFAVNLWFSNIRMDYEVILEDILKPEERRPLPHLFMMEMLEVNEHLMQLELAPEAGAIAKFKERLEGLEQRLCSDIQPLIDLYQEEQTTWDEDEQLQEFYYKRKYILRIIERLSTFASRDQVL